MSNMNIALFVNYNLALQYSRFAKILFLVLTSLSHFNFLQIKKQFDLEFGKNVFSSSTDKTKLLFYLNKHIPINSKS